MVSSVRALWVFLAACSTAACVSTSIPHLPEYADQQLIDRTWPYALIAYNAYHREEPEPGSAPSPAFTLPSRFSLKTKVPNDDVGLAYDIYHELRGKDEFVVFAFRGTENDKPTKGRRMDPRRNCDWRYGNFSLVQQGRALEIIDRYAKDHGIASDHLIFVGHSLGGGIAIHASYRHPGSYVYAFNNSPRFRKPDNYVLTATDLRPYRRTAIAQRREVLRLFRGPAREANQFYLPVECVKGDPIERHSMRPLATCLTRLAAGGGPDDANADAFATVRTNALLFSRSPPADEALSPPQC